MCIRYALNNGTPVTMLDNIGSEGEIEDSYLDECGTSVYKIRLRTGECVGSFEIANRRDFFVNREG